MSCVLLLDEKDFILILIDFVDFDDVWVVETFEDVDLMQQFFFVFDFGFEDTLGCSPDWRIFGLDFID